MFEDVSGPLVWRAGVVIRVGAHNYLPTVGCYDFTKRITYMRVRGCELLLINVVRAIFPVDIGGALTGEDFSVVVGAGDEDLLVRAYGD